MKVLCTILSILVSVGIPFETLGNNPDKLVVSYSLSESGKLVVSYSLSESGNKIRMLKEVKPGEKLLPGTYKVKANLSLKSGDKNIILESLNLESPRQTDFSKKKGQPGWTFLDKTYFWNPGSDKNVLTIPLTLNPTKEGTSITDYDELHIDYQDLLLENPSNLSVQMVVSGGKLDENRATVIIDGNQLALINSLDLSSVPWKKKGYFYLTRRALDLPHDSSWQYIRKNKQFFFQNRFHLDLSSIEAVDIIFKTHTSLDEINSLNCNLRIGFESLVKPTKTIECKKFQQKIFKSNENVVLRIWVGELFRSQFIKNRKFFLNEIIFHISQDKLQSIQDQPVESIQFRSLYIPQIPKKSTIEKDSDGVEINEQVIHFHTPIEILYSKRNRLTFPLGKLVKKTGMDGKIYNMALSVQPEHLASPAKLSLKQSRMISYGNNKRPVILGIGEKIIKRWGGPFFDLEENSKKIEWVKVKEFFPFNSPGINKRLPNKFSTSLTGGRVGSNLKFTSDPINWRGIQIHTQSTFTDWHSDKDGLIIEGQGNWVEIDWPVQAKVDKKTLIFIGIGEGKEDILDLQINPFPEGGELSPITVLPNKPERLNTKQGEIKRLKIKISLNSSPFRLQLKEMAVFQPFLLEFSRVLDAPTLVERETPLIPTNTLSIPEKKAVMVDGHLSMSFSSQKGIQNKLSWTTKIGQKVGRIRGLKVLYKVPPMMRMNNPCWLHFTLVGANQKVDKSICPEHSANQIVFSPEMVFQDTNFEADELLEYISWKVLAKSGGNFSQTSWPIDIAVSFFDYDIRSIRNDLLRRPILELNDKALFLNSLAEVPAENILFKSFWANSGSISIKDNSFEYPFFTLPENPQLRIKNVVFQKTEPISAEDWASLIKKSPKEKPPREAEKFSYFLKVMFFLLGIGVLWWGWRQKERFSSVKWLIELSPVLAQKQILVWLSIAAGHYLLGLIFSQIKWRASSEIFLLLAGLAVFLACRSFVWKVRPDLESRWPQLAAEVFRGSGTPYIASFLLTLVITAFFLVVRLDFIAEQIAVVGYYMLVVGVALEAWALSKKPEGDESCGSPKAVEDEVKSA